MSFECSFCKQSVDEGNVMVDSDAFGRDHITWLKVVCKECTCKLDDSKRGDRHHNLWELHWVSENSLHLLAGVLSDLINPKQMKWSEQAVNDFYGLLVTAHPKLAKDPIEVP